MSLTLSALIALAAPSPAQEEPAQPPSVLDETSLAKVVAKIRPAVEKATGVELGATFPCRIVEPRAFARAIEAERLARLTARSKGDKVPMLARAAARRASKVESELFLAKTFPATKEILICPANFARQAKAIAEPGLATLEAQCAVLVHEHVHAADELAFGWSSRHAGISDAGRQQAYTAVIEGHA